MAAFSSNNLISPRQIPLYVKTQSCNLIICFIIFYIKKNHQENKKSAEDDAEDIEIKICTQKNCQHCQKLKVVNEDHYSKMMDTPELCAESNVSDNLLHLNMDKNKVPRLVQVG